MDPETHVGPFELLAFLCELAMLALLVAAGHGLVDGWAGWLLGVVLAAVAVLIWSRWMAPTSSSRLADRPRLVAQVALFVGTAVLAGAAGLLWWGVVFALVATGSFVVTHRHERT
jgi:hypothetical protein